MKCWGTGILILVVTVTSLKGTQVELPGTGHLPGDGDDLVVQVGRMLTQVIEQLLPSCHLLLVDHSHRSQLLPQLIRYISDGGVGVVVVEAGRMMAMEESARAQLLLQKHPSLNCSALLIFLDSGSVSEAKSDGLNSSSLVSRFLEWCGLWQHPGLRVVMVGERSEAKTVLLQHSLRNALHALYLALDDDILQHARQDLSSRAWLKKASRRGEGVKVRVYKRCLYCQRGDPSVQFLQLSNISYDIQKREVFPDELADMKGHKVQVVVMPYFPFTDYERRGEAGTTTVTPRDSLDVRILNTLAAHLNFTYEMREPADRQWGLPGKEGNWTGIVGELQHQRADHSTLLIPNLVRSRIIQFCKLYSRDPMVIVSLKPQPHPRHLSIIRPFPGLVWQVLLLSLVCWSVTFWVMQKVWTWLLGGGDLELGSSLYFSWSVLLENSRDNIPHNLMARVLVGWWLVACLVVSSAYRSSLISHLSVQEYSRPINSFQDLVKRPGWTWGAIDDMRTSIYRNFFTESGPLIRYIYDRFEIEELGKGLEHVLKGSYSFITWKNMVKPLMTPYTNTRGQHPFHLSTTEYFYLMGFSWAFRKGAPFRHRFAKMIQRLIEAGLLNQWLEDVQARKKIITRKRTSPYQMDDARGLIVLSLDHLQGAFYVLMMGSCLASLTLVAECLIHRRCKYKETQQ